MLLLQRGNPILKHICNVPWENGSIIPDYVMLLLQRGNPILKHIGNVPWEYGSIIPM